jgi:lantibiotic modifying enzyme
VVSGKEVVHRFAGWTSKRFGVSLSAVKLAKELSASEIDEEIRKAITAIEEGEPFP